MIDLCIGCDIYWLRIIVIILTLSVVIFFSLPVMLLCWVQLNNYRFNKTSNERFARHAQTASMDDSDLDEGQSALRGRW